MGSRLCQDEGTGNAETHSGKKLGAIEKLRASVAGALGARRKLMQDAVDGQRAHCEGLTAQDRS